MSVCEARDEDIQSTVGVVAQMLLTVANVAVFNYEVDEAMLDIHCAVDEHFWDSVDSAQRHYDELAEEFSSHGSKKLKRVLDRVRLLLLPEAREIMLRALSSSISRNVIVNFVRDMRRTFSTLYKMQEHIRG